MKTVPTEAGVLLLAVAADASDAACRRQVPNDPRPTFDALEAIHQRLATIDTATAVRELSGLFLQLDTAHAEHADIARPVVRRMLGIARTLNKAKCDLKRIEETHRG